MFRSLCSICTDVLTTEDLMACPCGHVYHSNCLTRWFLHKKTCPTCRKSCNNSIKLYFNNDDNDVTNEDNNIIKIELNNEITKSKLKGVENNKLKEEIAQINKELETLRSSLNKTYMKYQRESEVKEALKQQVSFLAGNLEELKHAKEELTKCKRLQTMISGSNNDVQTMLQNFGNDPKTVNELATQLLIMKKENEKMKDLKKQVLEEKKRFERDYEKMKVQALKSSKYEQRNEELENMLKVVEQDNESLKNKLEMMAKSFDTSSPRSAIINRLLRESPAPLYLQQPVLTCDNVEINKEVDNEETSLFIPKISSGPLFSPVHPGALRQNRKRTFLHKDSVQRGRVRKGYDGLGGHSTIVLPSTSSRVKKKVAKPNTISRFIRNTKENNIP